MSSVRKLARAYLALLKASWMKALEYRAQVLLWLLGGIFPLVMLMVWLAVVAEAGPITGWGEKDFIAYYVGAALVFELTSAWTVWYWDEDIRTGNLSVKLLKPLDPQHHFVTEQLGWKIFVVVILVPILALVAWLSPWLDFGLSPARLGLFILSALAGYLVALMMSTTFGMIGFWSTQANNLYSLWFGVGQFLSGWIAPLALFPPNIRLLASWLPFRSTLGFPVEVLLGRVSRAEIVLGLVVSAGWILFFWIIYRVLWKLGLRRYEAVGA